MLTTPELGSAQPLLVSNLFLKNTNNSRYPQLCDTSEEFFAMTSFGKIKSNSARKACLLQAKSYNIILCCALKRKIF